MKNKKTGKIIIGVVVLVAIAVIFGVIYSRFSAKSVAGTKDVTIEVIDDAKESTSYEVRTDAEFLRQAMEEAGIAFEGTEGEYGLTVETVNGLTADYNADGAYWAFYVNDEYCNYGVDSQPVTDGDAFQIVYTSAE